MSLPPNARGVPPPLLSPPDTTDGVEMGRYLKRAACACASSTQCRVYDSLLVHHIVLPTPSLSADAQKYWQDWYARG